MVWLALVLLKITVPVPAVNVPALLQFPLKFNVDVDESIVILLF